MNAAFTVREVRTQRLDLGMHRPIRMSFGEICEQHLLLVRLLDDDGVEGVGEACVMGGPFWNADTIEGTEAVIRRYTAPHLVGRSFDGLADFSAALHRQFRGNGAARTALEMAALDLIGKRQGRAAVDVLGGAVRDRVPVAWTLTGSDLAAAIADGEQAIAERGHETFKIKVGVKPPDEEVAFAAALVRYLGPGVRLIIDANQAWTELQAAALLPRFADAGVHAVEQPTSGHDLAAMGRLAKIRSPALIADEALVAPQVAELLAGTARVPGFSIKPQRDGGLCAALRTAKLAHASGIGCYGGTMLETSLGTAALCALYAHLPDLHWGSELFGPLRLQNDIVDDPLLPRHGRLQVPNGPGLGIRLDEERIEYLVRQTA